MEIHCSRMLRLSRTEPSALTAISASAAGSGADTSGLADVSHVFRDDLLRYSPEIEPHAPGKDRGRQLLRLCGSQNEDHMFRRFLQCLEQRVESPRRQHMDFVDDIYFVAPLHRRIFHALTQLPDAVDAVVGRRVDFDDIHEGSLADRPAVFTFAAWTRAPVFRLAVERFGEDPGCRRLSGASGSAEQVGMSRLTCGDLIFQNLHDMILTDDLIKPIRPEIPVYRRIHVMPPCLSRTFSFPFFRSFFPFSPHSGCKKAVL